MKALLSVVMLIPSIVACAAESPTATSTPDRPLLAVEWRGGLCPYGGCTTTLEVTTDGAYRLVEGSGVEEAGTVASTLVDALSDAVATANFDAVRVHGSTEVCPTAYDGQEIVYTFHASTGDERMSTCEDVIEFDLDPLPQTLAIIEAVGR